MCQNLSLFYNHVNVCDVGHWVDDGPQLSYVLQQVESCVLGGRGLAGFSYFQTTCHIDHMCAAMVMNHHLIGGEGHDSTYSCNLAKEYPKHRVSTAPDQLVGVLCGCAYEYASPFRGQISCHRHRKCTTQWGCKKTTTIFFSFQANHPITSFSTAIEPTWGWLLYYGGHFILMHHKRHLTCLIPPPLRIQSNTCLTGIFAGFLRPQQRGCQI